MWDRHGHVVTNYHVVADVQAAYVRLSNQRVYEAALVGVSPEHDIAVLRIDSGAGGPAAGGDRLQSRSQGRAEGLGDRQSVRVGLFPDRRGDLGARSDDSVG
nr:S1C family serine protease [Thiocapsa sp.]